MKQGKKVNQRKDGKDKQREERIVAEARGHPRNPTTNLVACSRGTRGRSFLGDADMLKMEPSNKNITVNGHWSWIDEKKFYFYLKYTLGE